MQRGQWRVAGGEGLKKPNGVFDEGTGRNSHTKRDPSTPLCDTRRVAETAPLRMTTQERRTGRRPAARGTDSATLVPFSNRSESGRSFSRRGEGELQADGLGDGVQGGEARVAVGGQRG